MKNNIDLFIRELSNLYGCNDFICSEDKYLIEFGETTITIINCGEFIIYDCNISNVFNCLDVLSLDEMFRLVLKEIRNLCVILSISDINDLHAFVKFNSSANTKVYISMLENMLDNLEVITNTYEKNKKK